MARENILLVDDDPDIRDAMTIVLESAGYIVSTAVDGDECLKIISMEPPDLLILDLLMPKKDGFDVYRELRSTNWPGTKDMPIIIITSVREEASRRRYELETGQTLDVDSYIEKPISPESLINIVNKLIK